MLIAVAKEDADDLLDELDKRKVRHFEVGYVTKAAETLTFSKT